MYVAPPEKKFHSLLLSTGTGKGMQFPLSKQEMLIGRANRNQQWDIDLVNRSVSRLQAILERQGSKWFITDSGSTNGTIVNGERIHDSVELADGETLGIGETILIFRGI